MTDVQTSDLPRAKNAWIAFLLSLIFPGLGHIYLGQYFSGLIYGIMAAGVVLTCLTSRSLLTQIAMAPIYLFVAIPAARDTFAVAAGKRKAVTGEESRLYVIWMLCCVGPFALPLLWQNKKLSPGVKWTASIIVVSIAVFFLYFVTLIGRVSGELFSS